MDDKWISQMGLVVEEKKLIGHQKIKRKGKVETLIMVFGKWCWKHLQCSPTTPSDWDGYLKKSKHHEPPPCTHLWWPHQNNEMINE